MNVLLIINMGIGVMKNVLIIARKIQQQLAIEMVLV